MLKKIKVTWNSLSSAKKISIALIFASFCQKGMSMISTPIFTRIMSTNQYGQVTNFNSWQSIISVIATLNLAQGVFNNGMLEFKEDRDRFTSSILLLANICTCSFFGIYLIFKRYLKPIIGLDDSLIFLMFLYMFFYPAYQYWTFRQRYEYKYKMLTCLTIVTSFLQIVLSIIAVLFVKANFQATVKLVVSESVLVALGIVMYFYIIYKSKFSFDRRYMKYAFNFNIFLVPHFLAMTVLASGDRIMINSMVGASQTAIYGVAYTAAAVISIFGQSVEASWAPWLYEHLSTNDSFAIKKRATQIASFYAVIAVVCMLFTPEIMAILASQDYLEGVYIIPAVTAGVYFSSIYALYMRLEYYSKKTKATMIGSVFVAIMNIVLNYYFIPKFGYFAAGYTTLVCYILLYLFHLWYSRKIGMKAVYQDSAIFLISIVVLVISIVINIMYIYNTARYITIIGLLIVSIVFRKKLVVYIRRIMR